MIEDSTAEICGITYKPFGPITGLTYGNGLTDTRTYDQDYRLTSITVPNILSWTLGYNPDDDITGLTDNLVGGNSQTLGYDNLNRLNTGSGAYGSQSYGYDANGNRNTETLNGTNTTLNIAATSNQLASLSGGQNKTYQYDANGNLISDGTNTYTYDDTNRLASVTTSSGADTYQYNGLGQRIEKTVGSATTVYVYDEAGHLIGEYTPTGALIAEHIWLDNRPVGLITPSGLYYVTTDQLGTPRAITNASKTVVWQWHSDPFGNGTPTGSITYNLRFPGQYYDAETGHNYNYFRDYDPTIGRYIESDPIGLLGGPGTYSYVDAKPITREDSKGLYNYAPPDKSQNTVICDSAGNMVPQVVQYNNLNDVCLGDCLKTHEEQHIADLKRIGTLACQGKPQGTRVTFDTLKQDYASEVRAYNAEINCLKAKLKAMKCDNDQCRTIVNNRIIQIRSYMKRYEQ
ncbi:MAG: RHS repeat domain-containing protein [Gammaproteobacteria bacterium]